MKLYAPEYYKDFKCKADKCRHSCCIGWEIDVDSETAELYCSLDEGYGEVVAHSIDFDPAPHFRLGEGDRCPHLAESGLCKVILNLGEDHLCDICREHPRFYNDTVYGKEVGLGMACEEACRLILTSDGYATVKEIGEVCGEADADGFNTVSFREGLYERLSDSGLPYSQRLNAIYREYGASPELLEDAEWRELLASLEYLDPSHKELFQVYTSFVGQNGIADISLERALAYFIYRHCAGEADELRCRAALGLCLFLERLLASVYYAAPKADILELARIISEEIEYSEDNTEAIKAKFLYALRDE